MKKKNLAAKLSLKKKTILALNAETVLGGAKDGTVTICQFYSCTGEATCGIACTVIDCLNTQRTCDTKTCPAG